MPAAHVARRLTGRKLILMARYGYHGSYDDLEVGLAGSDGERTMLADFGEATAEAYGNIWDREAKRRERK